MHLISNILRPLYAAKHLFVIVNLWLYFQDVDCLQCFDAVGWEAVRASGLAWLSVWSEVQMIACGSADATATPSSVASAKS